MHIGEIMTADCANGLGMRVSVFVSGCTNHCKGCFQPQTWDFDYGFVYDDDIEERIMAELSQPYYRGLTILGGEPFEPANQETVLRLIDRVKKDLPQKDIWIYSGCVYERDMCPGGRVYTEYTDRILDSTDVLVDGPFEEELKDLSIKFRGSSNQRLIDMKSTRAKGQVVCLRL